MSACLPPHAPVDSCVLVSLETAGPLGFLTRATRRDARYPKLCTLRSASDWQSRGVATIVIVRPVSKARDAAILEARFANRDCAPL